MRNLIALILALLIGAGVYFYTPDLAHDALVARYGGPPTQPIALADGSTAYYRDQGNPGGLPVVLLHGAGSNLFTWEGWIPALTPKYRVITVDLPGHGLTGRTPGDDYSVKGMEDFVDRLTAALHIDRYVVGGNSMGGGVAANLALDRPERILGLILVDAAGVTIPGLKQDLPIGFKLARMPVVKYLLLWFTPKTLVAEGLKKSYGNPSLVTDAQVERYWMLLRHEGNRAAALKRFGLAQPEPLNSRLGQLTMPTLVLWGEADRLLPLDMGKLYAATIPGAQAVYFPGAGHVPQEEIAEQSGAAAAAFLDRLGAPADNAPELTTHGN